MVSRLGLLVPLKRHYHLSTNIALIIQPAREARGGLFTDLTIYDDFSAVSKLTGIDADVPTVILFYDDFFVT